VADLGGYDVVNNTKLLYQAQPTFVRDAIYNAKQKYGLYTADMYFNSRGQSEKYLSSSNGSNAAGGGWFILMPTGKLYAWDGVSVTSTVAQTEAASLGAGVYTSPSLLYSSTGQTLGVMATIDGNGQLTLFRDAAFTGTVRVTATVSDGAEKASRTFLFTVTNGAPSLPAITDVTGTSARGGTISPINLGAADGNGDIVQYAAAVTNNPLYALKLQYGLSTADTYFNNRGQNEKYFYGSATGTYFVLMSNNKLYAWDGVSLATTTAQTALADFTTSLYGNVNVYANTALLYAATATANLSQISWSFSSGALSITWPTNFTGKFLMTVYISDGVSEAQMTFPVMVVN
jgi:hypothetical protein